MMEICALYALHPDVRGDVRNRNLTMVPLQSFHFFHHPPLVSHPMCEVTSQSPKMNIRRNLGENGTGA